MSDQDIRILPTRKLGYAIDQENRAQMMAEGVDPKLMLKAARENRPKFNPVVHPKTIFTPLDQGNQGSCQGHSLALIFAILYFLATGRLEAFSRAAAYYLSQRFDGISGDRGSTLNGGRKVATQHGLCLESDWVYPSRYDPREPSGIKYPFRLVASKPTRDPEEVMEWLDMGLPVQDGIMWNNTVSRTLSTHFDGRSGGGHSTTLWTKDENENYRRINSWGMWDRDGCNENTPKSLQQQVEHRWSSHVLYGYEGMVYPELEPAKISF